MKKNGFTLMEVLISMVLSGMLIIVMATMLLYGHKNFESMYTSKDRLQDYLFFKTRLNGHLKRMVGPGFVLSGNSVTDSDIKFDKWTGGSWTGKVYDSVIFYALNQASGKIIKGQYYFDSQTKTVRYREWAVNDKLALPALPGVLGNPVSDDIVLNNATVFHVTNSLNGVASWEVFNGAGTDVANNLYLRVYIELDPDVYKENDVLYSFTEDYLNNDAARNLRINHHGTAANLSGGSSDVIIVL